MTPGQSYRFFIKRYGTSKLVEYTGRFLGEDAGKLVFSSLENAGVRIRVDEAAVQSADELDVA